MQHAVEVIYPGQARFKYSAFSNGDMDLFFRMIKNEWNHKSGSACRMFLDAGIRSFCVNDFLKIDNTYYRCTVYGMLEVTEKFVKKIEREIKRHPYCKERNDPFWAKLEVMEKYEVVPSKAR